jgi:putative transposase
MREHREYSLQKWAKHLGVSLSGYYDWLKRFPERQKEEAVFEGEIRGIFMSSRGTYGVERICGVMRSLGIKCSYGRVKGVVEREGLYSIHRRCRCSVSLTDSRNARGEGEYTNHTKDMFVERPYQLLTSDITYIRTSDKGFGYLCVVKDVLGMVLSHTYSEHMNKALVIRAIEEASARYPISSGAVFHSDRGSQYTSTGVRGLLKKKGFVQSFSAVGKPGDNAWSESFFSVLKKECVHWGGNKTYEEWRMIIFSYIESFYNTVRVQKRLGYKSPKQFLKDLDNGLNTTIA